MPDECDRIVKSRSGGRQGIAGRGRPGWEIRPAGGIEEPLELGHGVTPVGHDAVVGEVEHRRLGIGVDGHDEAGAAQPDHVVELAAGADDQGQLGGQVLAGDADLSGVGEPTGVGDLAGGGQLGAQRGRPAPPRGDSRSGRRPCPPTPPGWRRPARRGRRRGGRAWTATRPAGLQGDAGDGESDRRGRGRVARRARPGRTVTSCTGEVASMAATMAPPKAGFHARSRPRSSSSRSMASPVSPASSDGGHPGRHLPAPGRARGGHDGGLDLAAPLGDGGGDVLLDRGVGAGRLRPAQQHHLVGAPAAEHPGQVRSPGLGGEQRLARWPPPGRRGRRPASAAVPSSSRSTRWRPGSTSTATTGPPGPSGRASDPSWLGAGCEATWGQAASAPPAGRGGVEQAPLVAARRPPWPPARPPGPTRRAWRRTTALGLDLADPGGAAGLAPRSGAEVGRRSGVRCASRRPRPAPRDP